MFIHFRYIHKRGIVHRDLKLGNMFLTSTFIVKIGDFGLATAVTNASTSSLCGTPNYIAPEVLQKRGHGFEADLWAIGCMAFAMMSGNPPFETKSLSSTYAKIASNSYTLPPNLSKGPKTLITQLLHPEPSKRGNLHLEQDHPMQILNHPFIQTQSNKNGLHDSSVDNGKSNNWKDKLNMLFNQKDNSRDRLDSEKFVQTVIFKISQLLNGRCGRQESYRCRRQLWRR